MKFSLFNPWPVYGVDVSSGAWPMSPRLSAPTGTTEGMQRGFGASRLADELGFDYVTVAEHHYHPRQLSPNPLLTAAALAQHLDHAGVAVLGATLPLVNPIRTAEEIAMVDAMTGGNMLIGMFRGTPNEYLTYGTNPAETREVFEEAVELIVQAWTQPEPFAWVGRYYDYRMVAVWPRPVSAPHPKILVSANSPSSAIYAAQHRFKVGISFAPLPVTTSMTARFISECQLLGYTPPAEDILYRTFCFVAETDEKAEELVDQYRFGDPRTMLSSAPDYGVGTALKSAIAAADVGRATGASHAPPVGPPVRTGKMRPNLIGSPDTVARKIREFADQTGVGHFDLVFNDVNMDYDHATRSIELFGREVLPQVHGAAELATFAGSAMTVESAAPMKLPVPA